MTPLRVAVCCDFPEERWPSMDRVAAKLVEHLRKNHGGTIEVTPLVPRFMNRVGRIAGIGDRPTAFTIDRLLNRLWDYPRYMGSIREAFDVFHVIDHSYAQLVHRLPADRTIVTCHDLDTFRSLLRPDEEPRSRLFKAMARHVLAGMQRAARVTCDTAVMRNELVARGILAGDHTVVAPVGVGPEYSEGLDPDADRAAAGLIQSPPGSVELLHVGSTIPRKRIDVLLKTCGELRRAVPNLHLVRVGGAFTVEQCRLAQAVGMGGRVSVVEFVNDRTLAAIYRRAALVLLPSDREGFGLPLVEAMACGTPIVASDLPALREVGGTAIEYCPPGSVPSWSARTLALLDERSGAPERWSARRETGLVRARRFTWSQFAARLAQLYCEVAAASDPMLARTPA